MSEGVPVLRLRGIARSFHTRGREVPVLREVDLEAWSGRLYGIAGPSGSGKTTLLHLAALLDRPDRGEVVFDGVAVRAGDAATAADLRRRHIGMVFQRFHLLPHRSALHNVLFRFRYADTPERDARARAQEALREVGLADVAQTPARLLSGGEMQRVAIARALAMPPRLLLADEPTGNLDAVSAEHVMRLILQCRGRGIAVLLATHNPAWLKHCDEVRRLERGRLVPEGAPG